MNSKQIKCILTAVMFLCIALLSACMPANDHTNVVPADTASVVPVLPSSPEATTDRDAAPRQYRYSGQKVEDWLGDFPEADSIRVLMLEHLDNMVDKSSDTYTDDYYYLFLGIPLMTEHGLILPAGKRGDGEWMPDLYYIELRDSGQKLVSRACNDVWNINRCRVKTDTEDYSVFFGIVPVDARLAITDDNAKPLVMHITSSAGEKTTIDIPGSYPYFLAAFEYGEYMAHLSVYQGALKLELILEDGDAFHLVEEDEIERILCANFYAQYMTPLEQRWSFAELPQLFIFAEGERYPAGGLYAMDMEYGGKRLQIPAHAPMEQALMGRSDRQAKQNRMVFEIEHNGFDLPARIVAELVSEKGEKDIIPVSDNRLTLDFDDDAYYSLYIKAEYAQKGYMEWMINIK